MSLKVFYMPLSLYFVSFLFVFLSPNKPALMMNAKLQTLSRLTPPIDYFEEFIHKKKDFNPRFIDDCIYYHQKVVDFIPSHRAEGYAMIGFCQERKGRYDKALAAYQESLKLNPAYFWTYYNIASIYYNQRRYDQAVKYYEDALDQDSRVAALVPMMSKVYKDVISSDLKHTYALAASLNKGYEDAALFLVASLWHKGDYDHLLAIALSFVKDNKKEKEIFYYYAGLAAYQLKFYDKAIVLFQKYLKTHATSWEASYYLGLSLKEFGKDEYAQNYLFQAQEFKKKYGDTVPSLDHAAVKFF